MIVIHEASHARLNQIANLFLESDLDDPVSKVGTIVGHQELNRASVGREERPFARHFEPCFQLLLPIAATLRLERLDRSKTLLL